MFPLHLFIAQLMIVAAGWIAYRVHDQYAIVLPFPELAKIFVIDLAAFGRSRLPLSRHPHRAP